MATALAPPAPSTFGSSRDMMDSLLENSPVTEVIEQQAPPLDPDAPEDKPAPKSEVAEDEELTEDETPPAEDDEADESIDSIKDGKKYRVNPTKMRRLLQASEMIKAVQDHFEPSPEAFKKHYEAATSFGHMSTDFKSADPANIAEFMKHWNGESAQGFATLAQNLPAFLAQNGQTAALSNIEQQVQNAIVQRTYNEVAQIAATPVADRSAADKAKLYKAQTLDYALNGKYKTDAEIQQLAQRVRQTTPNVDRRAQQLDQQENNFINSRWQEFDSQFITGAKETALNETLDAAFKPVEGKYSERILKSLKRDAREEIQAALDKRYEWKRNQDNEVSEIQRAFRQALKTNQKTNLMGRIDPLVSEYRQVVSRIVPGVVKSLTPGATKAAVDDNKAEHERLARGARQTAPSAGGAPAARSPGKGNDYKAALDRVFG